MKPFKYIIDDQGLFTMNTKDALAVSFNYWEGSESGLTIKLPPKEVKKLYTFLHQYYKDNNNE